MFRAAFLLVLLVSAVCSRPERHGGTAPRAARRPLQASGTPGDGIIAHNHSSRELGMYGVPCRVYNATIEEWQNDLAAPLRQGLPAADLTLPYYSAYNDIRMQLCSDNNITSAEALTAVLNAGGKQTQAALTAVAFLGCPDGMYETMNQAWKLAIAPEFLAAVQAAGEVVGMAGCISLAAAESGQVVDMERAVWGSQLPWPTAGEAVAVNMAWNVERCYTYNQTAQEFTEDPKTPLLESAPKPTAPPEDAYKEMLNLVCTLGAAGAPLLVKALAAGGDEARLAVAVMFADECPGLPDTQPLVDATDVLIYTREFSDPQPALAYMSSFQAAAQANGMALCISTVFLDADENVVSERFFSTGAPWNGPTKIVGSAQPDATAAEPDSA